MGSHSWTDPASKFSALPIRPALPIRERFLLGPMQLAISATLRTSLLLSPSPLTSQSGTSWVLCLQTSAWTKGWNQQQPLRLGRILNTEVRGKRKKKKQNRKEKVYLCGRPQFLNWFPHLSQWIFMIFLHFRAVEMLVWLDFEVNDGDFSNWNEGWRQSFRESMKDGCGQNWFQMEVREWWTDSIEGRRGNALTERNSSSDVVKYGWSIWHVIDDDWADIRFNPPLLLNH